LSRGEEHIALARARAEKHNDKNSDEASGDRRKTARRRRARTAFVLRADSVLTVVTSGAKGGDVCTRSSGVRSTRKRAVSLDRGCVQ